MTIHDATEVAYKNGYAAGKRDALKWIPVTERLPETCEDVLVNCLGEYVYCGFFEMGVWYFDYPYYEYGDYVEIKEVTHWMPLPTPPKEDA